MVKYELEVFDYVFTVLIMKIQLLQSRGHPRTETISKWDGIWTCENCRCAALRPNSCKPFQFVSLDARRVIIGLQGLAQLIMGHGLTTETLLFLRLENTHSPTSGMA